MGRSRIVELVRSFSGILPGNAACPGCPETMGLRYVGMALGDRAVLVVPAGCSSVIQGISPLNGFNFPTLNIAFAAAPAAASGMARAYKRRGVDAVVVVWAGDGATADIGFASLSGAAERNEDLIYIAVDNEAYMNTGVQRSGLTPYGAVTTTTPIKGKREHKKNLPLIMIAHGVPYVATASVSHPLDFIEKLRRAAEIRGFKYIHLLAPDPYGWGFDPSKTVEMGKLAVETGYWVLFEYLRGELRISPPSKPYLDKSKRKPISEFVRAQARFRHLSEEDLKELERAIDNYVNMLLALSKASA